MSADFLHLVLALSFTSATTLLLGIFVYFQKSRNDFDVGRVFFLYCIGITWWSFFQILHITSQDRASAVMWARIMEIGAFFIPTFFVHFVWLFLRLDVGKSMIRILYATSFIFASFGITPGNAEKTAETTELALPA